MLRIVIKKMAKLRIKSVKIPEYKAIVNCPFCFVEKKKIYRNKFELYAYPNSVNFLLLKCLSCKKVTKFKTRFAK